MRNSIKSASKRVINGATMGHVLGGAYAGVFGSIYAYKIANLTTVVAGKAAVPGAIQTATVYAADGSVISVLSLVKASVATKIATGVLLGCVVAAGTYIIYSSFKGMKVKDSVKVLKDAGKSIFKKKAAVVEVDEVVKQTVQLTVAKLVRTCNHLDGTQTHTYICDETGNVHEELVTPQTYDRELTKSYMIKIG
jgi:hypothetical protein